MRHLPHKRRVAFATALGMSIAIASACGGGSGSDGDGSGSGGSVGDGDGTGASGGDGDSPGGSGGNEGNTGGDSSTGGGMPMGGSSGQVLVTLGDECSSPGTFACAENNPKLALICGADGMWESRETCSGEALCDFNAGPNEGTCRAPLPECGDDAGEFCQDQDVIECKEGGFETTVVEECAEGCEAAECVWLADECVEDTEENDLSNCSEDECPGATECGQCGTRAWGNDLDEIRIVRLPTSSLCEDEECGREFYYAAAPMFHVPEQPMRFKVGRGWGMIQFDSSVEGNDMSDVRCGALVEQCVIVPPVQGDPNNDVATRGVVLIPTAEELVARNLTVEVVDPGTTCD